MGYRFLFSCCFQVKLPTRPWVRIFLAQTRSESEPCTLALLLQCLTYRAMRGHESSPVECLTSQPLAIHAGLRGASEFSLESSSSHAHAALVISSEHKCQSVNNLVEFIKPPPPGKETHTPPKKLIIRSSVIPHTRYMAGRLSVPCVIRASPYHWSLELAGMTTTN